MKTAILISGQMRTFGVCLRNMYWHLFRRLPDAHIFISCADDAQAKDAELIRSLYNDDHVRIEVIEQPTLVEPPSVLMNHAPYGPAQSSNPTTVVQSLLRQLWHRHRVWQFFRDTARGRFDVIVRCRPDLYFHGLTLPSDIGRLASFRFYGPWKATCGGVNDRLGIMGPSAAEAYFTTFSAIDELLMAGCPLHPESLLLAQLERLAVEVRSTLLTEFSCIRPPGAGDHVPLVEYPGELARFIQATIRGEES